jgi:3-isopropylmalate/(R)-2-methylmalate dehydratase small subunit
MEPFTRLDAVAAPLQGVNVDTDRIVPARFLKFSRAEGYDRFLFHDLRLDDDGVEIAGFVLNRPQYREARILVADANFGCGSSREGAVYALFDYGFRAVIAPSFGDIFHNNCFKNGLLAVRLEAETTTDLRAQITARPGARMVVDLEAQTVSAPDGTAHAFAIDAWRKKGLIEGLDELGSTMEQLGAVDAFEAGYRARVPWLA